MKKRIATSLVLMVMLLSAIAPAALATPPTVEKAKYEGNGRVEVEFRQFVRYKSASVIVEDSEGKRYETKIIDRDDDGIEFRASGLSAGKTYSYTISGVRKLRTDGYGSVSGSFKAPEQGKASVKNVDYSHDDREVEFEFAGRVRYKNAKVSIKDTNGRSLSLRIAEKDSEDLTVRLSKRLSRGAQYCYIITGVIPSGASVPQTLTGAFRAIDD